MIIVKLNEDLIEFLSSNPLYEKGFSVRIKNGCKRLRIDSLFDMFIRAFERDQDFMNIFGYRSIQEIKKYFRQNNINLEDRVLSLKIKNFYMENYILFKIMKDLSVSQN